MKKSLLFTAFLLCCFFEKASANPYIDAEEYLCTLEEESERQERQSIEHPGGHNYENFVELRGQIDRIKEFLSTHPEYKTWHYNLLPKEVLGETSEEEKIRDGEKFSSEDEFFMQVFAEKEVSREEEKFRDVEEFFMQAFGEKEVSREDELWDREKTRDGA